LWITKKFSFPIAIAELAVLMKTKSSKCADKIKYPVVGIFKKF